ncbi:unnamed protein product [Clonostachys byssicola]|uniref:Uncharacterized protein n=1 Tax=Clonostachys byssicola TaxID=160290 RepID=A0A9N9UFC3_9HYPO|nr:unnamed protein product [Clonostachys byssicola]
MAHCMVILSNYWPSKIDGRTTLQRLVFLAVLLGLLSNAVLPLASHLLAALASLLSLLGVVLGGRVVFLRTTLVGSLALVIHNSLGDSLSGTGNSVLSLDGAGSNSFDGTEKISALLEIKLIIALLKIPLITFLKVPLITLSLSRLLVPFVTLLEIPLATFLEIPIVTLGLSSLGNVHRCISSLEDTISSDDKIEVLKVTLTKVENEVTSGQVKVGEPVDISDGNVRLRGQRSSRGKANQDGGDENLLNANHFE